MYEHRSNIEKLRSNPVVSMVDNYSVKLTADFRIQLFHLWKRNDLEGIERELERNGLGREIVGRGFSEDLIEGFKRQGFPVPREKGREDLLSQNPILQSGKFLWMENRRGIKITPEFAEELFRKYPEVSVEDGLRMAGLDPIDVGYMRLQKIKKDFDIQIEGICRENGENTEKWNELQKDSGSVLLKTAEIVSEAGKHPYVNSALQKHIRLKDRFYNEAYLLYDLGLEKILELFELPGEWFNQKERMMIISKLRRWIPVEDSAETDELSILPIWQKREAAMTSLVAKQFEEIGRQLIESSIEKRRLVARWIDSLPRDPWGYYTKRCIQKKIGFAKSTYYELLHNEEYGTGASRRKMRDDEDILLIRQVLDYRGYKKGYRQICMMMEDVTGRTMSPHRVLYLMRRYGMRTNLRRPSRNRKAMKELIERNGKPNLLMRRFKQHRPNEVRLTDVTYLDYGNDLRAYGSASIDPVTSKLICFVVSENNDLRLALDTLEAMDAYPLKSGGIIHSDQGILYFTDDFQKAVKDRDLIQSMSRRGNCWDNAPQESFFGHFKDECDYKKCRDLEELQAQIDDYRVYYNEKRRLWERGRRTPIEYESYLEGLDDKAFRKYMKEAETMYLKKKEVSAQKAVEKAKGRKKVIKERLKELKK